MLRCLVNMIKVVTVDVVQEVKTYMTNVNYVTASLNHTC